MDLWIGFVIKTTKERCSLLREVKNVSPNLLRTSADRIKRFID